MARAPAAGGRQGPTTVRLYDRWSKNHRSRSDSAVSWVHIFVAGRPDQIASAISCLGVSVMQQCDYLRALMRVVTYD